MKPRRPIRRQSKRQTEKNKEYAKAKRLWWRLLLSDGWVMCQVGSCRRKADKTPHHILPRSVRPDLLADTNNFLAVCRWCHSEIHRKPAWARGQGYMGRSTDSLEELAARRQRQ